MANLSISRASKWFSNQNIKLIIPHRSRCHHRKSDTLSPPMSPLNPKEKASESQDEQKSDTRSTLPMSPLIPKAKASARENELQCIFRYFDGDGDGKISSLELRAYFASMGEYMSYDEAQSVINDLDTDSDGLVDFREFMQFMERDSEDEDLRRAFEMFEVEKGSGCITPNSLQRMLIRLGDTKSYEECVAMIRAYDLDHNGMLDFHEFQQMMAHN